MLLPIKTKNPPETTPYATIALMLVNLIVYVFTTNGLVIHKEIAINYGLSGNHNSPLNWFSSAFLHADLFHLLGNMWFFYLVGFAVEGRLKWWKFLIVYAVSHLVGSLLHYMFFALSEPTIPAFGASGAIMGVMGAALFMFPFSKVKFVFGLGWYYWTTFEWPMWGVCLYYLGVDLFFLLINLETGTAHFAHLGGALGGFLMCMAFLPQRDSAEASEAKSVVSDAGSDFSILSSRELADIAKSTPDDPFVALHWMFRSIRDPYGVKPECAAMFHRLLPRMMREMDEPVSIGTCLLGSPAGVPVQTFMECAHRVEKQGQYAMAVQLFDRALKDPQARQADIESAMFRIAILSETALGNPQRAFATYREIVNRFGVSPMADQARARAADMERRGFQG
jgi:membrane associated rhomboid family serine protease